MNQREAVYAVITSHVDVVDDRVNLGDMKDVVVNELCAKFEAREVDLSEKASVKYLGNAVELRKYVVGLVNNWVRKDPRLNGNVKYQAKNPGSRAGSGDAIIKNLKLLLSTLTDDAKRAKVEAAIAARQAEIKSAKQPEVDLSVIDPALLESLDLD